MDAQRRDDLARAAAVRPAHRDERGTVHVLPDAPWSRRVIGTLSNELARAQPQCAHAVLRAGAQGWQISLRAPLQQPYGAAALARRFGGSGRAAAAAIDRLPSDALERFIVAFTATPWSPTAGHEHAAVQSGG
jgi:hypothetical protein